MPVCKPLLDDNQWVPDRLTVDDACCGRGHDTDNSAEGEDCREDGQLDILAPGRAGVTREIGNVTSEGGPGTSDRGHAGEPEVGFCAAGNGGFHGKDVTASASFVNTPSHGCESGNWGCDQLCCEEIAEVGWWDQEEGKLDDPEEEITGKISVKLKWSELSRRT